MYTIQYLNQFSAVQQNTCCNVSPLLPHLQWASDIFLFLFTYLLLLPPCNSTRDFLGTSTYSRQGKSWVTTVLHFSPCSSKSESPRLIPVSAAEHLLHPIFSACTHLLRITQIFPYNFSFPQLIILSQLPTPACWVGAHRPLCPEKQGLHLQISNSPFSPPSPMLRLIPKPAVDVLL